MDDGDDDTDADTDAGTDDDHDDDTDDDSDHKNDSCTAAGAGPLVLAPWSGLLGPGSLVRALCRVPVAGYQASS